MLFNTQHTPKVENLGLCANLIWTEAVLQYLQNNSPLLCIYFNVLQAMYR